MSETPLTTELLEQGSAVPPLRPLSLGELLDRALQLFRAHFFRLALVMLAFQVPSYALSKGFSLVSQAKAPILTRPGAFRGQVPDLDQLLWLVGGLAVTVFGLMALYQLAVASLTTAAARAILGERVEAGRALREGLSRAPHLLATFFLLLVWVSFLLTLSIVPGVVVLGFGMVRSESALVVLGGVLILGAGVVVGLYLLLRYALVSEVVVIERLWLVQALRRSARLMSGRVGPDLIDRCKLRASVLFAVNFCISVAVAVVTSLPSVAVNAAWGVSMFDQERNDPALVPLWASVPVEVLQVLAQSAVAPFGLLAIIAFYFDLRIRREGFDLEVLATRTAGKGQG